MSTRKSKPKPKKSTITRLDKLPSDNIHVKLALFKFYLCIIKNKI